MAADELCIFRVLNQDLSDGVRLAHKLIHDLPELLLADHFNPILQVLPHDLLVVLIFLAELLPVALLELGDELVHYFEGEEVCLFSDEYLLVEDLESGLIVGTVVENAPFVQHLEELYEPLLAVELLLLFLLLLLMEVELRQHH